MQDCECLLDSIATFHEQFNDISGTQLNIFDNFVSLSRPCFEIMFNYQKTTQYNHYYLPDRQVSEILIKGLVGGSIFILFKLHLVWLNLLVFFMAFNSFNSPHDCQLYIHLSSHVRTQCSQISTLNFYFSFKDPCVARKGIALDAVCQEIFSYFLHFIFTYQLNN